MESTERLVRTWIATSRDQELEEAVSEISNDKTSLLNIVKALGPYLTSEEDEPRTKGVDFLSSVIARLPPTKFNITSVKVLTTFYCEKLDDTETIIPALKGLVTLTALPSFTSTEASTVIMALFNHVRMKALVQSVRFNVFTIVDTLMAKHREALRAMNKEFLDGYINLAEGEKDPRNLLIAFAIARVILIEFDITRHVESLFNITFCYFPITFRPPPNDPSGISTEQLRVTLRQCLNATPSFGPLAIPLFLEKLLAGSPTTKRDTLQSLAMCFHVYGPVVARSFARKLWSTIKLEIFQPVDSITEQEALKTMQELIKTIYSPEESSLENDEDIQGLAREACHECLQILKEPEKSQAKPAIKVLCAFITTTPSITRFTVSQAVPHLIRLFMDPDEALTRPSTMSLLSDLIIAARDSSMQESELQQPTILASQKDYIFTITMMALGNASSRNAALSALRSSVTTKKFLSDEDISDIVNHLNDLLQADGGEDTGTSDAMIDLLATIGTITPRHIEERTLPILLATLPDVAPPREAVAERAKCWRILATLGKLCTQADLFETLVGRLMTKLDLLCVQKEAIDALAVDMEPTSAYAHAILTTISQTLAAKTEKGHNDIAKHINKLVPHLYNLFFYSALMSDGCDMAATDYRVIGVAAQIITTIGRTVSAQRQEVFLNVLVDAILHNNLQILAEGYQKLPSDKNLDIFKGHADAQKNLVALVAAVFIPLYSEVKIPVPDINQFLHDIFLWSIVSASNDLQRDAAWHILSVVVNKRTEDILTFLDKMLKSIWPVEVLDVKKPSLHRRAAVKAFAWLTKGLHVKGNPLSVPFVDALFDAVKDDEIGWTAAKAIGEIAAADDILTKKNHAIVKILYAQKHVNEVLPRIIANARGASDNQSQAAYLVALTALIRSVPRAAYVHAMPTLMPLLLRGLDLPDADVRASVIDTLLAAANTAGTPETAIISEHATSLVSAMLRNCMVDQIPSIRVRISALRFLAALPGVVRYDVLHPSRLTVVRELDKALDDPKRAVRKEAIQARTKWFKYTG